MRRMKMSRSRSRRSFSRNARRTHVFNVRKQIMRGGYRL